MIELIKIDLLPYREALLKKKKQKFQNLMVAALGVGLGLAALGYFGLAQAISAQEERNAFLEAETKKLDEKLQTIAKLKAEKADFLARKQKVEELQKKRFEGARIIDTINHLIPEGVYLTEIQADKKNPNLYTIMGKASSDNRIAMFMRALPTLPLFGDQVLLKEIKQVNNGQMFSIEASLRAAPAIVVDDEGNDKPAAEETLKGPINPIPKKAEATPPTTSAASTPKPAAASSTPAPVNTPAPAPATQAPVAEPVDGKKKDSPSSEVAADGKAPVISDKAEK